MATVTLVMTQISGTLAEISLIHIFCRCKPPARCVPVVLNGNTAVQLPKQGESFGVSDIIGRCISPCPCDSTPPSSQQVCGSDGRTYPSACFANCANIEVCVCVCVRACVHMINACYQD